MNRRRYYVVVIAMALGLGSVAPSPASASYFEDGIAFRTEIIRDSVPYSMNFKVLRAMGGSPELRVTIGKSMDPEGSAVVRQRQIWTYALTEDEFVEDQNTWRIDAGGPSEPLDMNLLVEERDGDPCADGAPLFVTEMEGPPFRIETGNATYGTITELPACASPWSFSSGERPGPPPCPVRGHELYSSPLNVSEHRRRDIARFRYSSWRERDVSGHRVDWRLVLRGAFPEERFSVERDLDATVTADRLPWLSGTAAIATDGRLVERDWYNCRGGREARSIHRQGSIGGDLTIDVIGYHDQTVAASEAFITRAWVRARR